MAERATELVPRTFGDLRFIRFLLERLGFVPDLTERTVRLKLSGKYPKLTSDGLDFLTQIVIQAYDDRGNFKEGTLILSIGGDNRYPFAELRQNNIIIKPKRRGNRGWFNLKFNPEFVNFVFGEIYKRPICERFGELKMSLISLAGKLIDSKRKFKESLQEEAYDRVIRFMLSQQDFYEGNIIIDRTDLERLLGPCLYSLYFVVECKMNWYRLLLHILGVQDLQEIGLEMRRHGFDYVAFYITDGNKFKAFLEEKGANLSN